MMRVSEVNEYDFGLPLEIKEIPFLFTAIK